MSQCVNIVRDTLLASIPPHAPPMFKEIVHAHSSGQGKRRQILADLILFDGETAGVKLEPFQWGWSIQWMHLPGGAFFLNAANEWQRETPPQTEAA